MGKRGPLPDIARTDLMHVDDHKEENGLPIIARGLDKFAQEMWDEMYPALVKRGLVTITDSHQLRGMCEWWSEYRRAAEGESRIGKLLKDVADSIYRLSDNIETSRCAADVHAIAARIEDCVEQFAEGSKHRLENMNKAWKNFSDISAKFAMTPADRLRMSDVKQPAKTKSPIEEFMEKRKAKLG